MDPYSLFRIAWRFRLVTIPVVALTLVAAGLFFTLGPRVYEAGAIYVIANPDSPTEEEKARDSRLARLNDDNPYIRTSDPSLIVKVLSSKLTAANTQQAIDDAGFSTDYTVGQSAASPMTLTITGVGKTASAAIAARDWLIDRMQAELRDLQKVNNADDSFLFTALAVDIAPDAVEKLSSRLRSLILVIVAGGIVLVTGLSLASGVERRRLALTGNAPSETPAWKPDPPRAQHHERNNPTHSNGNGHSSQPPRETAAPRAEKTVKEDLPIEWEA